MIKTVITSQNNNYTLIIRDNYIGKEIEILFYALDELEEKKHTKKSMADFWGTMSDETAGDLHKQSKNSREEWEDRLNKQF